MMAQFSPFTRRLIALALLFFAAIGLLNLLILPLASAVSQSMSALADARFRLAHLEAIKARPEPPQGSPVPPAAYLAVTDMAQATEQLRQRLTALATQFQLRLDVTDAPPPDVPTPGRTALAISVNGGQDQVLNFINSLEQEQPVVRFKTWRLARDTSGSPALPVASAPLPTADGSPPSAFDPNAGAGVGAAPVAPATPVVPVGPSALGQPVRLDAIVHAAWSRQP